MEVIDKTDGVEAEKTGEEASFALTNKNGGFCIIPPTPKSRFEGVFFKKGDNVFKVIESIRHHKPVTKVVNQLWKASREMEGITESYCMPLHSSSLIYELNEKAEFDIVLDCKHIYDNREWGRTYELSREQGCLLIKFSKKKDERDAESEFNEEFDIYIAVYGNDMEYRAVEKWEKVFYELDKERDSKPFERHVFYACMLRCKEVVFAFSTEKKTALKKAKYIWRNRQSLKREKETHVSHIIHQKALPDTETAVAYQCSLNAIDSLLVKGQGISAGLPWFFQFWARDELISLKALINMGKFLTAKKILFKNLELISDGGKIPQMGHSGFSRGLRTLLMQLRQLEREKNTSAILR